MRGWLIGLALLGCSSPGQEHEGDLAWHAGRWDRAMTSYHAAGDSPRLLAKYADAALRGGYISEAVQGWSRLAEADPTRRGEAATGLARAAQAADAAGNRAALAQALIQLRQVDPDWPVGRLQVAIPVEQGSNPAERVQLWLLTVAAAQDRNSIAAALHGLGDAELQRGDCLAATGVLQGAAPRLDGSARDSALASLAGCEVQLGERALFQLRPSEAAQWFLRPAERDPGNPFGRRALIGLGDARLLLGDTLAAVSFWEKVIAVAPTSDSLFELALERLHSLSPTSDSLPVSG